MTIMNMVGGKGETPMPALSNVLATAPADWEYNGLARMIVGNSAAGYGNMWGTVISPTTTIRIAYNREPPVATVRSVARNNRQIVTVWDTSVPLNLSIGEGTLNISDIVTSNDRIVFGAWNDKGDAADVVMVNTDGSGSRAIAVPQLPLAGSTIVGAYPISDTVVIVLFHTDAEVYYIRGDISESITLGQATAMNITPTQYFRVNDASVSNGYLYLSYYNGSTSPGIDQQVRTVYFQDRSGTLDWGMITGLSNARYLTFESGFGRTYVQTATSQSGMGRFLSVMNGTDYIRIEPESVRSDECIFMVLPDGQVAIRTEAGGYWFDGESTFRLTGSHISNAAASDVVYIMADGVSSDGSYQLMGYYSSSVDRDQYSGMILNDTAYLWN